jgi:hypothetical protein
MLTAPVKETPLTTTVPPVGVEIDQVIAEVGMTKVFPVVTATK